MEATFVVNPKEIDAQLLERMLGFFADRQGPVTVHLAEKELEGVDWQDLLRRMEALRRITEQVPVDLPPGTDINDLIDEINDNPL